MRLLGIPLLICAVEILGVGSNAISLLVLVATEAQQSMDIPSFLFDLSDSP